MILNTGSRTDIPAYYSDWFYNRIKEGYVLVRNPYNPTLITKYLLNPELVDVLVFCTKNPIPFLNKMANTDLGEMLLKYDTFWFVTITPYGEDIEPFVPPKERVMEAFRELSRIVGSNKISWRYDPIFISGKYSMDYHIEQFEYMAKKLAGYTKQCVVSFIDLYEKTKRNFGGVRSVTSMEQEQLIEAFSQIAEKYDLQIHLCCENLGLVRANVDSDGCMSQAVFEKAIGCKLDVPKKKTARKDCNCLLGADIGAYNTCGHGCLYCYANYDRKTVLENMRRHNPASPLLVGDVREEDEVKMAEQKSWKNGQLDIFDILC